MNHFLFNSVLYFQRYAPDKLRIAKVWKGSNSVTTDDRAMVLAFCDFPHGPVSVYLVSFNNLQNLISNIFICLMKNFEKKCS